MYKSLFFYLPVMMVGWFATPSPARAQSELPRSRVVTYNIHKVAEDPQSPVMISMGVSLTPQDRVGNQVGWYPESIAITQYDEIGTIVGSWTESFPEPSSTEPLWYVTHADPMQPASEEFFNPPELSGRAESNAPNGPSLDYYVFGKNPTAPPVAPYPITSIIDYTFQRSDEPEPIGDDTDKPAETPEGSDNPS